VNLTKKLLSGSAIQIANLLLEIIIGFLLLPFLIEELSTETYGLWILVMSIVSFLGLMTLGLSSAVQRFLSMEISVKNYIEYQKTTSSSIFVFLILGFFCIFVSYLISTFSANFVTQENLVNDFQTLIILMGCNIAIKFFSTPFRAALTAEFKFITVSTIDILTLIIKTFLTLLFIHNDMGVVSLGYALIIGEASGNLMLARIASKKLKAFKFSFQHLDKIKIKELFKFSINSFIASLGDMFRFPIDNIIISSFIGLSFVTIYSIPVRLLSYANAFILQSLNVLQPMFAKLHAENKVEELRNKFEFANHLSFCLAGLLASGLFVFGENFIELWINQYDEISILIIILPVTLLVGISQQPTIMILYAINKHKYYAYQNIIESVFNIILSLIFLQYWGIYGVAIGTVLPMVVGRMLFLPRYACKQIDYSLTKYYKIYTKSLLLSLLMPVIANLTFTSDFSWFGILFASLIFSFIYVAIFFALVAEVKTKDHMINLFNKALFAIRGKKVR